MKAGSIAAPSLSPSAVRVPAFFTTHHPLVYANQSDSLAPPLRILAIPRKTKRPPPSPSLRDAPRGASPLPLRDAWHGEGDPERYARGARPSRGCPLRDELPLRDDGAPRVRDVPLPCDDALPLAST